MRSRLRRLVAVGVVATAVDILVLWFLHDAGVALAAADAVALVAAAVVSYSLHRTVTLRDDPFVRWIHHVWLFVSVVFVAGLVDLGALVLVAGLDARRGVVGPKIVAVALAAVVRFLAYRYIVFRVVRRDQDEPARRPAPAGSVRLSVIVPAYGEEARIGHTIERLRSELHAIAADGGLEIVVVDDGSADATAAAAEAAGADLVLRFDANRGKGAAVRAGVLASHGRVVAFTDADLAYAPTQIIGLLEQVEAGWDAVVGSRRHAAAHALVRAGRVREMGSRVVNIATHALLLGQYRDTQCGLKAFRSDVARLLFSSGRLDGFAFDIELFHLIERHRLSLAEVPVAVENSERSTVRAVRDGLRLLADLMRVRRWAKQGRYARNDVVLPPRAAQTGRAIAPTR